MKTKFSIWYVIGMSLFGYSWGFFSGSKFSVKHQDYFKSTWSPIVYSSNEDTPEYRSITAKFDGSEVIRKSILIIDAEMKRIEKENKVVPKLDIPK